MGMKTLKLDHNLAQEVLRGTKTSTWRLYDDKDLSVNDELRIIDKVKAGDPASWRVIGVARINSVVQKRLQDVSDDDYEGHNQYANRQAMIDAFRNYYGPQVNEDTVVKIIRFTFNNDNGPSDNIVADITTKLTEVNL